MPTFDISELNHYVEQNIQNFHDKRFASLSSLKLANVLLRKNPYLFKAKNVDIAADLVKGLLDAHLSSQEETLFGSFLEGIAVFVCGKTYGGFKSHLVGIDLEFMRDESYYIVSIKSGPKWANADQQGKMKLNFAEAQRKLLEENPALKIIAVNGCCYGRDAKPAKQGYYKYCGQLFWELVSGDPLMYINIIEPLGYKAKDRNDDFQRRYSAIVNKFTQEFSQDFCDQTGQISWDKIVALVSKTERP